MSSVEREEVNGELKKWSALPVDQRQRMAENFHSFFELSNDQKKRILGTLSLGERQQMENSLKQFGSLPPPMRQKCIDSYIKFAGLSVEERDEFLKNAQRWESMTAKERQAWRELVDKLPPLPPMPPGIRLTPPPPPFPPSRDTAAGTPANRFVTTNSAVPVSPVR